MSQAGTVVSNPIVKGEGVAVGDGWMVAVGAGACVGGTAVASTFAIGAAVAARVGDIEVGETAV